MARFKRLIPERQRPGTLHLIIAVAVALRLGAALLLGNGGWNLPGIHDQISYHNLALRVINGFGFSFDQAWWPNTPANEPTAHWSYLYTFYLGVIYWLLGPHPVTARIIQAVATGVLQPYLTYLVGRQVFCRRVGLASAGLSAIYGYFVYYAAALMTETFYIVAVLASIYFTMRLSKAEGRQDQMLALGLGLASGAAVLLRQVFLLMIPVLIAWLWWSRFRTDRRLPLMMTVKVGLVMAAMILPFTLFNYARFRQPVLLNTNAGFAFFWANHPIHGTSFEPILPRSEGTYQDLIPRELLNLDEPSLERALLGQGIRFVLDDPVRYARLSLSRIPAYFMFWPSSESSVFSNVARVGSFGLLLPVTLAGLGISILGSSRYTSGLADSRVKLLMLFSLLYSSIHILTWALIRYRLPVDALLVLFAGLAIVELSDRFSLRRPLPTDFAAG